MPKNYLYLIGLCFTLLAIGSCQSDDDYTSLLINTNPDTIQVFQNATVQINVLENDTNIPAEGFLQVTTPTNGTVEVLDPNNTPNNPNDDLVSYIPNAVFYGEVTFQYTICNLDTTNCATETVTVAVLPISPVTFNIENVPYENLSDYNFFEGSLSNLDPVYGVLPYRPINKLFTDYAHKKRFIWMPSGVSASYAGDYNVLDFPVGTVLIKHFYYENVQPANNTQLIETRLLIKKADEWVFANYIWNEDQTEASFDLVGGYVDVEWLLDGETKNVNYRIPSESECFTCHKNNAVHIPISPKPQNLDLDFSYEEGTKNQLQKWIEMGYLTNSLPNTIDTVVDWTDESQTLNSRMRAYVDINCAHCHVEEGHCNYRPVRFAYKESGTDNNMGVCVDPETVIDPNTKIVEPLNIDTSVLYFRLNTTAEEYRMPLMGRTLIHQEAVELVEQWINSLTTSCD